MDDVWLSQNATPADFEACLKALSLQDKDRPPPLLAVASASDSPHLVLASRAFFRLFEVTSGEALSARLLGGIDPGARRLAMLCRGLALEGAPRLERLRFFIGPGTEIITFLCRRVPTGAAPLFIAAALGVRPDLMPPARRSGPEKRTGPEEAPPSEPTTPAVLPAVGAASTQSEVMTSREAERPVAAAEQVSVPASPMSVQAIHATLRTKWPASRTVRFLWQSDAEMVCTQVGAPLAEIVGANADIVGRDLMELAPQIDPTGRLADALATKKTWSGLEVVWPLADAPAAVAVGLGAIPAIDRERGFDGYRGYGVINPEPIDTRATVRISPASGSATRPAAAPPVKSESDAPASPNVVRFPGSKALSAEDQKTFTALGLELRQESGLGETGPNPLEPVKSPPVEATSQTVRLAGSPAPPTPAERRTADVARHGLAILDRLSVGLLVSRDNIPIFANRHLLDGLGFADEDALHEAGGMRHLFGGQPGNVTGSESIGIRGRDGRIVATNARMQTIEWDGLAATLLTLFPASDAGPVSEPSVVEHVTAAPHSGDDAEARELRAILETATDGVAIIDADCNVISLNRSGEALFGCDRSAVVGKPFLGLFAANNQGLAADYLDGLKSDANKRLLNDGRELLVKAHQGGTIPVFMTLGRLAPSTEGADERPRFCALFRDLTHWKKVERDLETAKQDAEHANALKTDFLARVSHEVRTPLNAIIGFAEVMMDERFGPIGNERYKDYLRDIHGSGTHVMSLVNDLLDLSKIEAGKMELASEPIDINKVVNDCVAMMQPQASRERVIMRLSLAPGLPQIRADERSLRQIVLNILSNAVKFNEPGGQVIVATTRTENGNVVVRIRDTGTGMSEEDISAALEPFRQLATTRPSNGGTGLGLPLTKALVEANQATFSIRSKVDQGTLVEVAFPAARVLAGP